MIDKCGNIIQLTFQFYTKIFDIFLTVALHLGHLAGFSCTSRPAHAEHCDTTQTMQTSEQDATRAAAQRPTHQTHVHAIADDVVGKLVLRKRISHRCTVSADIAPTRQMTHSPARDGLNDECNMKSEQHMNAGGTGLSLGRREIRVAYAPHFVQLVLAHIQRRHNLPQQQKVRCLV